MFSQVITWIYPILPTIYRPQQFRISGAEACRLELSLDTLGPCHACALPSCGVVPRRCHSGVKLRKANNNIPANFIFEDWDIHQPFSTAPASRCLGIPGEEGCWSLIDSDFKFKFSAFPDIVLNYHSDNSRHVRRNLKWKSGDILLFWETEIWLWIWETQ